MSIHGSSFLEIDTLSFKDIHVLFSRAKNLKNSFADHGCFQPVMGGGPDHPLVMAEAFFEPSTRTRLSFQMAARRLGFRIVGMDIPSGSSVQKGESVVDTIETIAAMKPDIMVVRSRGGDEISQCLRRLKLPVINAGAGTLGHPTQALLDAFTMREALGELEGKKLLFVGDVLHSRVANSNLRLMAKLGVEVAICCPSHLRPQSEEWQGVRHFSHLADATEWCDVVMGLRVQTERHDAVEGFPREDYIRHFRLDSKSLSALGSRALILHPGPFVPFVDFHPELLQDPRCLVREQVTNGVFVRAALMTLILQLEVRVD